MDSNSNINFTDALDTSLKTQNLVPFESYLSKQQDCSDVLNKTTITTLMNILKKEKKRTDRSVPVQCVLSCLQHFLESNIDPLTWLQLSEDIGKLFDTTFSLAAVYLGIQVVQKCAVLFTDIVEYCSGLADDVLRYMLKSLLKTATVAKFSNARFEVLSLITYLLLKSSRELRSEVVPSNAEYLVKLSECLVSSGSYELQATIVEVLARCRVFMADLEKNITLFPTQPQFLQSFSKYNFLAFDTECRLFLNEINESLEAKRLVHTLPCMIIQADNVPLKKPADPLYKQFWVDFNSRPESITIYFMRLDNLQESGNWDTMEINFENVTHVTAKNSQCRTRTPGVLIDAVKLEFYQKETPKHLKIYFQKNSLFETVESVLLKEVLKNKYKSEIEFERPPTHRSRSSSRNPIKFAKDNNCKLTHCKYNRLDISILSNVSSIDQTVDVNLPEESFINISTNANTTLEKGKNTTESDSDEVSPSPSPAPRTTSRLLTSHESEAKICEDSDNQDSESFTQFLKEQEAITEKEKCSDDDSIEEETKNSPAKNQESRIKSNEQLQLSSKTETSVYKTENITKNIISNKNNNDGITEKDTYVKNSCFKTKTTMNQNEGKVNHVKLDCSNSDEDNNKINTTKTFDKKGHLEKDTAKSNTKSSTKEKFSQYLDANCTEEDNHVSENLDKQEHLKKVNAKTYTRPSNKDREFENITSVDNNSDDNECINRENHVKNMNFKQTTTIKSQQKEVVRNVVSDGNNSEEETEKNHVENRNMDEETPKSKNKSSIKGKVSEIRESEDESSENEEKKSINEEKHSNGNDWDDEIQKINNKETKSSKNKIYTSSKSKTLQEQKSDETSHFNLKSQNEDRLSNKNKDTHKSSVTNESLTRKRLYSYQNDEALMLSSQDDVLSVGVPSYKISKAGSKTNIPPKAERKNVTFSYIDYKEKKGKSIKNKNKPTLPLDKNEIEEQLLGEESDEDTEIKKSKPSKQNENKFGVSAKKACGKQTTKKAKTNIRFLSSSSNSDPDSPLKNESKFGVSNKPLEKGKTDNIFPTHSIYSDFSSAEKNSNAKKTCGKQKSRKAKRNILYLSSSSNSDPDYDPDKEMNPQFIQTRERKRKNESVKKPLGIADRLKKVKVDPTRGCSSIKMRRLEVEKIPFVETIETRVMYQQEIVKGPKKERSKTTCRVPKNKNLSKPTKNVCYEEDIARMSEDDEMDFEPDMDIVPCQPENLNELMGDDWSLGVFINPPAQNKKLQQATYKINDMVQIGKSFNLQVKTTLNKVHNLAEKERQMNISAFDYKVQSSISSMQTQFQKLEAASKTLANTKIALDSTCNVLKETHSLLKAEASRIEHAQIDLKKNLAQAEKTETTSIASIFQGFGRYMRNVVLSLIQNNQK